MATRRRIIEGRWRCTSCGSADILGRHKACPSCGSPRERDEMKMDFGAQDPRTGAAHAPTVTDSVAVAAALAGADWSCAGCGAGNRGDTDRCKACSSPRSEPGEGAPTTRASTTPPSGGKRWPVALALVAPMLLCAGLYGWWSGLEHDVEGEVRSRSWERTEVVQGFNAVVAEGWRSALVERPTVMPREGRGEVIGVENVRGCERRQSGTVQVPDGTEQVCTQSTRSVPCGTTESCSVNDLGNGFAEEVCSTSTVYCDEPYESCTIQTRYRTEPVYDDWCRYDTWAWQSLRTETTRGGDEAPAWPGLQASGDRERLVQSASYRVTFAWEDDGEPNAHSVTDATLAQWQSWPTGAPAVIRVNNGGDLRGIRHPGEPAPE